MKGNVLFAYIGKKLFLLVLCLKEITNRENLNEK